MAKGLQCKDSGNPIDVTMQNCLQGTLTVTPGSIQGSGVLINGPSGFATIPIVKGEGSMTVRTVRGISGDTLTFDPFSGNRVLACAAQVWTSGNRH